MNAVALTREPTAADLLGDIRTTDIGNSQRLAFLHGDKLRWSPSLGWLQYDGALWDPVDEAVIYGLARDVPRLLLEQAAGSSDPDTRQTLARWAVESERLQAVRAMVSLLKSEPGIMAAVDDLDSDPWLLNVPNGTIDLRTGRLRAHDPGDMITKMAGAEYDSEARAPRWEQFILEVMDGDHELAGYLQRFTGYCLTGDTSEQVFLFCSGSGANGKSVFIETVASVLGDYAEPLSPTALVVKYGDQSTNELAGLRGARLAFCSEIDGGKTLDSGLLKALTGGDSFRVRLLYREFFSLKPQLKLVYNANGQPRVRDSSYGFWRRCRHVPFGVTFKDDARDNRLREKLEVERSGILNWALEGLREWQEDGLQEPGIVMQATREYQDDQSVVRAFLDDRTKKVPGHCVPLTQLHEEYLEWAKRNGEKNLSNRALKRQLEETGVTTRKGMVGVLVEDMAILPPE